MIAYFDTSAVVPLLIEEPTSAACRQLWNAADRVLSVRIGFVEAAAALSRAERTGRVSRADYSAALESLDELFQYVEIVELDDHLCRLAADLTDSQALRGYDAVQCAAALMSASDELVAVSGDARLITAWLALGVATADTSAS